MQRHLHHQGRENTSCEAHKAPQIQEVTSSQKQQQFFYKKRPQRYRINCGCFACSFDRIMNHPPPHVRKQPLEEGEEDVYENSLEEVQDYIPTAIEELANTLTHGIPAIIAIFCLYYLVLEAVHPEETLSVWIYGLCMIFLFFVSSMYHLCCLVWKKKAIVTKIFHKLDHAMIYTFIAASYTPYLLIIEMGVDNIIGKSVFFFIWCVAIFGIIKTLTNWFSSLNSLVLYLGMGWIAIFLAKPVWSSELHLMAVVEVLIGGLFYTGGTFFFVRDGYIPFAHAIWHIFVVLGSGYHFHAVYAYLMELKHLKK